MAAKKLKFSRGAKTVLISHFERSVLLACAKIPRGQTRTYKQIAISIGKPRSFRAVANALAKNPFAPSIPCHRVIRSDGKIGGYSAKGGSKRKAQLLKKEKAELPSFDGNLLMETFFLFRMLTPI